MAVASRDYIFPGVSENGHHDPLELLTVSDVSALIKRSRSSLYKDIHAGRLHIVKLGRSTRVPRMELERYIHDAEKDSG